MFSTDRRIPWQEHRFWFCNSLKKKNNFYFIGFFKNKKIGFVRIEETKEKYFDVSINIKSQYRNKGLGKSFLKECCKNFFVKNKNKELISKIKKDNLSSKRIFEFCNFLRFKEDNKYMYFYKKFTN